MALAREVQAHLDAGDSTDLDSTDLVVRRAALDRELDRMFALFGLPGPLVETRDHLIPSAGSALLSARTYHPIGASIADQLPLHVLLHGGGWTTGSFRNAVSEATAQHRATAARCVVLAVDYSLAPEHRFPTAVHDVVATVSWARAHAVDLGIDPGMVSLGGASAGANLAAAAVLADPGLDLAALVLDVPVLDLTDTMPINDITLGPEAGLTREMAEAHLLSVLTEYLPHLDARRDPLASPVLASDLRHFPETHLFVAEHDLTRAGAESFARVLEQHGVPVTVRCYEGALHGSGILTGTWEVARRWHEDSLQTLRDVHTRCAAPRHEAAHS